MTTSHDALLLLGHGSTLNADSSAPTYRQAEELRRRGLFADVQVGFWKEEPNFRQALRQLGAGRVFVVPNFISSGYFTEQVIPRELGLTGTVSIVEGREVVYCPPVGLHPSMTEALLRQAREVVDGSGEPLPQPAQTACLFVCGHGTSLNDNSTKIIHEQAELIRARGLFADCQGVLMEQAPFVKDWRELTLCPDAIVVPFFISDGLHSFEDIPVLLGLTPNVRERSYANPHREGGRRLWYATALGTHPYMADVILAQVETMRTGLTPADTVVPPKPAASEFPTAPWTIGQVRVETDFTLHHVLDDPAANLRELTSAADLRESIRLDEAGNFRPLRAAPNLRRGWRLAAGDFPGVMRALDYLYPAEMANAALSREERLPVTPWAETAERQTGRFRVVREMKTEAIRDLVAEVCDRGCLKRRLWSPVEQAVPDQAGEVPLLCPEACNFLVGKARERLKGPGEES